MDFVVVLVVILILVVMWRGPKTLPRLGEALGRGVREARREAAEITDRGPDKRDEPDATGDASTSGAGDGDRGDRRGPDA